MLLQIGVRAPDGSDPLGLLGASYRRHLSRLRALSFAGAHLLDVSGDQRIEAEAGLIEALDFFSQAADEPFREEAELLFPRLLARAGDDPELLRACQSLGDDRGRASRLHHDVAELGRRLRGGELTTGNVRALALAVEALDDLYRNHLERLEAQVFPRARALLNAADQGTLAEAMLRDAPRTVEPGPMPQPVAPAQS